MIATHRPACPKDRALVREGELWGLAHVRLPWLYGLLLLLAASLLVHGGAPARAAEISGERGAGAMALIEQGRAAPVLIAGEEHASVLRAAGDLRADLGRVAGREPALLHGPAGDVPAVVIVGTLGESALVDRLVREGKLDSAGVAGEWEAYLHQLVENPMPGVAQALVIAGSDRRGTIFGMYDLSRRIGVSPWYWWADVPVQRREALFVLPGRQVEKPTVRYRGIFINDEEPALGNWARETLGGINAPFYEKVFELTLRLRGNYIWPAMWGKSFHEDDPANASVAQRYGVVVGTSHHEPLMRAHADWERNGGGAWDYATNARALREFWREGMERTQDYETLVTVGMRGDGDEPMTEGTATALLETIVADQREIIADVTGRPAEETPQVWALYKEVQDYYDAGMQVPDDVTLLFADDNWGNIRRLPEPGAERPGGYGVYYHFDYVGGPRNYKWINTTQIERVWEQMHLAWRYGADRLWIVNVGDIKPMEYPTSFFLDYAWAPEAWPLERLGDYSREWAAEQFGAEHAAEIGELLTLYAQYAARRKPELLDAETYSLVHFDEAQRVVAQWSTLRERALAVEEQLSPAMRDAYFQLVLHPILANANQHELWAAVGLNRLYAEQGRAATDASADLAERLFARDREIRRRYEEETAGGKWPHMMAQTHISYDNWQQPEADVMPQVRRIAVPARAAMAVAVEGARSAWPGGEGQLQLPAFDPFGPGSRTIELFNRGAAPFRFAASAPQWVRLTASDGIVDDQMPVEVSIDWDRAPEGRHRAPVHLRGSEGSELTVWVETFRPQGGGVHGFVASNGYVAIDAVHYARAVETNGIAWQRIPHLGLTGSAVTAFPVTAAAQQPGGQAPHLEYPVHLFEPGEVTIETVLSPTLEIGGKGLRYAISIDDEVPQIVDVHEGTGEAEWNEAVAANRWVRRTRHQVAEPGAHVVKLWLVDPGLVFQRLHVLQGELPPAYLGPPESARR